MNDYEHRTGQVSKEVPVDYTNHFVSQNAADVVLVQVDEPVEASELVVTHLATGNVCRERQNKSQVSEYRNKDASSHKKRPIPSPTHMQETW